MQIPSTVSTGTTGNPINNDSLSSTRAQAAESGSAAVASEDSLTLSSQAVQVSSTQSRRKVEEIYNQKVNKDYVAAENYIDYDDYLSVDDLAGLTDEEKSKIKAAIKAAVTVDKHVLEYRDTPEDYALSFAETKMKLDFIANHMLPDEYKDRMLTANSKFVEEKADQFNTALINVNVSAHTWAVAQTGPAAQKLSAASVDELNALVDGTSAIQSMQKKYLDAADQVSEGTDDDFMIRFKAVLKGNYGTADVSDGLNQYLSAAQSDKKLVNDLTDDWDTFITNLDGDFQSYLVPSADHPLIDTQV